MIQELLGGRATGLVGGAGERKISINTDQGPAVILQTPFPPSSSSPSLPSSTTTNTTAATTTTTATTNISTTTTTSSAENQQNLRCPRCDSTNTKFCYYNNYNLTQPRHFCKTCRRYWTKGGALRNVPIGGGCRKNKGGSNSSCGVSSVTAGCAGKSIAAKARTVLSISDFDKRGSDLGNGFVQDHFHQQQHSNPLVWNSPSQSTSHILALLRAAQNPNPNPSPNPLSNAFGLMKSEGLMMNTAINGSNPGLDSYSRAPSPLGLCSSTGTNFWKNNDSQQQGHQQQSGNGLMMGEVVQNSGLQELFQKLKSSSPSRNYYGDHHPAAMFLSNNSSAVTCSSSPNSTMLESAVPAAANHDFGYFTSPSLLTSWSDLPTPNGAYP